MTPPAEPLPPPGFADVRITAASPETARMIAQVLRVRFPATEQRGSSAAGDEGTRLRLRVDTAHVPEAAGPFRLRLVGGGRDAVGEETDSADRAADRPGRERPGRERPGHDRPGPVPPAVRSAPAPTPAPRAIPGTTRPPTTGDSSGDRPAP